MQVFSGHPPQSYTFLVPTLLRGNAYITLTVSCSHAGAWEQEVYLRARQGITGWRHTPPRRCLRLRLFLVPTLLRGNAYITLTVSCSHAGAWEQEVYLRARRGITGWRHTPPRRCLRLRLFLVPTLLRGNAYITLTVSCSHAPAWECIHYADRFLFPRGSMGTRSISPSASRNNRLASHPSPPVSAPAAFSRSHAPAWECIHYADRFLFPRGSMGTRSISPSASRNNRLASHPSPPVSAPAAFSRSHAPAWECIHYADRFSFPRGSMGTRSISPSASRNNRLASHPSPPVSAPAAFSRSHAPAWECIHYTDRFLFPRSCVGMHTLR